MLSRIREIKFSELPELCSSILAEAIRNTSEYYIDLIGKVLERTEAVDNCPLQECRHRDEYVEICKYIREYLEPSSRTCIEITGLLYVKENALMYPK